MLLIRIVAVWLLLIGAEVVHGVARAILLVPRVGDLRARQIGVFSGSALILAIASLAAPWLRARTAPAQMLAGSVWLVLTLWFEIAFGRLVVKASWERIGSDYNLARGGLLPLGLAVLTLAPWIGARLARGTPKDVETRLPADL